MAQTFRQRVRKVAQATGLLPAYRWVRFRGLGDGAPPPGRVRFGDFRRLEPMSREYGFDRGRPIDRYYIETFLKSQQHLITGRVLEIGERLYTEMFGQGVAQSDMLHVADHPDATYVDDITDGKSVPSDTYDCVIFTQTLHLIFDAKAALATIRRILKPGGVLLLTVPYITQVADSDWNETWFWAFSQFGARKLTASVYGEENVEVKAYGNVLAAISFLQGLADHELKSWELDFFDPEYPMVIGITARATANEPTGN